MKGKDSYPPAEVKDGSSTTNIIDLPESDETSSEVSSEGDDVRGSKKWDGSEAEIVVDDEAEDYEEETTGIKIRYKLRPEEIRRFIGHSESYNNNKKVQKKHTIILTIIFVAMIILEIITGSGYYIWLAVFPLVALALLWLIPFFSVKRLVKDLFKDEETEVEIFPDKIEVTGKNQCREIPLDGSCESEELDDMILLFPENGVSLIIPLRAVEPEFEADVQAMIFSGARPRYKN